MNRAELRFIALFPVFLMYTTFSFAQEQIPQQFEGFNLQGYTDEGQKAWDVKGDTADVQGQKVKLSNVNANSYGEQKVNVTAEVGMIDQASGNMRLEKDVVITSEDGTQMMTDTLDWNRNDDLVSTDDKVFISDEGLTVTGKGMDAKPGLKNAQIHKDVRATVDTEKVGKKDKKDSTGEVTEVTEVKKDEGSKAADNVVTITCDGPMVIEQLNNRAEFNDNVVAVQGDRTLKADKLEIIINKETSQIDKMIGTGHVVVEQGENKSFAEKLIYDAKDQKLQLLGRPKLQMIVEGDNGLKSLGD